MRDPLRVLLISHAPPLPLPDPGALPASRRSPLQEKAGLERELKMARSQAEKLTKNMDKVGGEDGWVGG